jgi:hypothetical protein
MTLTFVNNSKATNSRWCLHNMSDRNQNLMRQETQLLPQQQCQQYGASGRSACLFETINGCTDIISCIENVVG